MVKINKIISGGQTGVDRAALDFGLAHNIEIGGWCPKGRRAEDGSIPSRYPLKETHRSDYPYRTILNVTHADGTLVLHQGRLAGGSALTVKIARNHDIPCQEIDLLAEHAVDVAKRWIQHHPIRVINIAGPRESENLGIHDRARAFLEQVWLELNLRLEQK